MNTDTVATILITAFLLSSIVVAYLIFRRWRRRVIDRIQSSPRLGGQTARMREALRRSPDSEEIKQDQQ